MDDFYFSSSGYMANVSTSSFEYFVQKSFSSLSMLDAYTLHPIIHSLIPAVCHKILTLPFINYTLTNMK